ncbi:placenta-specific gene 8 protein-like [Dendronephthya gigantea]|uniref:placenta-specific gene 8 protein-like n=1 Tax=Dendronephthya gigantea TaxID=151771 RepID=UPI00106927D1|nr:placenta-specific gene 8 protein-like [Dendronephthya gigantea]
MYNAGSDHGKAGMAPYYPPATDGPPQPGSPLGYPPQPMQPYPPGPPVPMQQQPGGYNTTNTTNTTVVIQQQPAAVVVQGPRDWSSGLCACFDDCGVCMVGLCSCMCGLPIIECQVSGAAGECCCVGIYCPIALRTKIRTRHNIQGGIVGDCCAVFFCHYCAFCQMQREINMSGM